MNGGHGGRGVRGLVRAAALAAMLAVAGCTPGTGATGQHAYTPTTTPRRTASPGAFLAAGDCAARTGSGDAAGFRPVPCGDRTAVARVTVRGLTGDAAHADCPATTDLVLSISGGTPATPATGAGYACLRNLRPPHPGDPGQGGGPNTIVGDCVYRAGSAEVRETSCDGTGARPPQYRVVAIVAARPHCPARTALYVGVGHGRIGCAEPR